MKKKEIYKNLMKQLRNIRIYLRKISVICSKIDRLRKQYSELQKRYTRKNDYSFFHNKPGKTAFPSIEI